MMMVLWGHYFWIVFTVTRLMQPKEFVVILLTRLPEQSFDDSVSSLLDGKFSIN